MHPLLSTKLPSMFHSYYMLVADDSMKSRDKLARTPTTKSRLGGGTWHDTLLQDSIGPLSSTRISQGPGSVNGHNVDRVATRLFSDENTGVYSIRRFQTDVNLTYSMLACVGCDVTSEW